MRILLDGCIPKRLRLQLSEYDVRTAPELGWGDLDDGPLLNRIEGQFDVFITVDKSLPKQQQLASRPFGTVILRAKSNRLDDLLPLIPSLRAILKIIKPGEIREVHS